MGTSQFASSPLWVADKERAQPQLPRDWTDYTFWHPYLIQNARFTSEGTSVDRNVLQGTSLTPHLL